MEVKPIPQQTISNVGYITPTQTISGVTTSGGGQTYNPQPQTYDPQPQTNTGTQTGGGGWSSGSVLGTMNQPAPVPQDPYAKYGGLDAFNRMQQAFNNDLNAVRTDASSAANMYGRNLNTNILDWIENTNYQQSQLDRRGARNESTRIQGSRNVQDMVGQGIRSGGAMLNQRNASDSSAAEGIAKAYSRLGSQGMNEVQNQYLNQQGDLTEAQAGLKLQTGQAKRKFDTDIDNAVDNIVRDSRQQLAILEAAQIDADMPTRIDIEVEKQAIKNATLKALAKYDKMVAGASFTGATPDQLMAEGYGMANAGLAGDDALQFTAEAPQTQQGAGLPTELPIFTYNRDRQEV